MDLLIMVTQGKKQAIMRTTAANKPNSIILFMAAKITDQLFEQVKK
jgi:hypothetical protein